MPLLKACSCILAHIEGRYPVPDMHVDLAKMEQRAQPSCLFTGAEQQGVMERRMDYASDTAFSFVPAFTDKSFGFAESCNLTRINSLYTETDEKVRLDQRDGWWVKSEVVTLRQENWKLRSAVKKASVLQCSSD